MKAHLITVLVVDHDNLGAEGIQQVMLNVRYPNRCIMPDFLAVKTAEIGEWSDDHPLNNTSTAADEVARLFAEPAKAQRYHTCDDPLCAVCGDPWAPQPKD